jgi:hypothetical protein
MADPELPSLDAALRAVQILGGSNPADVCDDQALPLFRLIRANLGIERGWDSRWQLAK